MELAEPVRHSPAQDHQGLKVHYKHVRVFILDFIFMFSATCANEYLEYSSGYRLKSCYYENGMTMSLSSSDRIG